MASYLIIGSGRLALHFSHYFSLLNIPFEQWSRKSNSTTELPALSHRHSHILLLLSDDSILSFYERYFTASKHILIHMSGCLTTQHPLYSIHPLMTFSHDLYDEHLYREIPFILDQSEYPFSYFFPDLPNPHYCISPAQKALYHTYCAMSGNFSTILWEAIIQEFQNQFLLPKSVLMPYLKQITYNLVHAESRSVLTGPLVRNDQCTIQTHLSVLPHPESQRLYLAFIEFFNTLRRPSL